MDKQLAEKLGKLARIGAATVHEGLGQRGYVDAAIAPLDPATRIAGPAYTVEATPGDNLAIHYALAHAAPGDCARTSCRRRRAPTCRARSRG